MRTRLDARRHPQLPAEEPPPESAKREKVSDDPLVEFIEARIAEKESGVRRIYVDRAASMAAEGGPGPLGQLILAECAMKRTFLANWRAAAEAEGVARIEDAVGTVALSCRSMLRILAAEYKDRPDYQEE